MPFGKSGVNLDPMSRVIDICFKPLAEVCFTREYLVFGRWFYKGNNWW